MHGAERVCLHSGERSVPDSFRFLVELQGHSDLELEKDRLVETIKGIEPLAVAS
jgi:hypothetical protein